MALQINTALQIVEMFSSNLAAIFLNNSDSNWGRQTAVFQFLLSFHINQTSNLCLF